MVRKPREMHVYGPVPSRRLGYSLGVDILPYKTCSLDCIYCQLGPTHKKTHQRKKHLEIQAILDQIKSTIDSEEQIDYITFSGSGEPTLNLWIGKLIREIKKLTSIPVAVLTNSTLLSQKRVRDALSPADLVIPSLDAATQSVFERINRPHPSLQIKKLIEGLIKFRQQFSGQIWLEILLVKGVNDSPDHLKEIKKAITAIKPDRIQLNTVVRPPAEKEARPLKPEELDKIKEFFGKKAEVVAEFDKRLLRQGSHDLEEKILAMVARRPVTLGDMNRSLGKHKNELIKHCDILIKKGKIKQMNHEGKIFYELEK
jgi:wyosine [tRNA(Phe)-imidazoG37] synthetase (radical SAM superfamily)